MSDRTLQTPFGILAGVSASTSYPDGSPREIKLDEKNLILTHAGELIPFYNMDSPRRKNKYSLTFHKNGTIQSVSLQEQQDITTPVGEFPAELVTFYNTGELKRFFVLDGQLSGFWSEEDERALNIPLSFAFSFASFAAMITGICFYKSGSIRSLTLFPGETIELTLKNGEKPQIRTGFSLYEDGALHSFEPAAPLPLDTPIGRMTAYDVSALGIHADSNSVTFDEQGRLTGLVTSTDRLLVTPEGGSLTLLTPLRVPGKLDPEKEETLPLTIAFDYEADTVAVTDTRPHVFSLQSTVFLVRGGVEGGCSPADCAGCTLCSR